MGSKAVFQIFFGSLFQQLQSLPDTFYDTFWQSQLLDVTSPMVSGEVSQILFRILFSAAPKSSWYFLWHFLAAQTSRCDVMTSLIGSKAVSHICFRILFHQLQSPPDTYGTFWQPQLLDMTSPNGSTEVSRILFRILFWAAQKSSWYFSWYFLAPTTSSSDVTYKLQGSLSDILSTQGIHYLFWQLLIRLHSLYPINITDHVIYYPLET